MFDHRKAVYSLPFVSVLVFLVVGGLAKTPSDDLLAESDVPRVVLPIESPELTVLRESAKTIMVHTAAPVPVPRAQPIWPVTTRSLKADKGVFLDDEAAGDLADAAIAIEDKDSSKHMLAVVQ